MAPIINRYLPFIPTLVSGGFKTGSKRPKGPYRFAFQGMWPSWGRPAVI